MNRLDKKCFIAAAATHGLLILILVFGSAFFVSQDNVNQNQTITFFDPSNVSDAPSSTHNPNATPTPLPPQAPPETHSQPVHADPPKQVDTPKPAVPVTRVVEPIKTEPKIQDNKGDEPKVTRQKHRTVLDDSDVQPTPKNAKPDDSRIKAQAAAKAAEDARREDARRTAAQFNRALKTLSAGLSSKTDVEMTSNSGASGAEIANYKDIVYSKYYAAWNPPPNLEIDSAITTVSIAISRDGRVVSAHVTKSSNNVAMDKSVERTLEALTFIEPFPAGSDDQIRKFTIKFNLQAKR